MWKVSVNVKWCDIVGDSGGVFKAGDQDDLVVLTGRDVVEAAALSTSKPLLLPNPGPLLLILRAG